MAAAHGQRGILQRFLSQPMTPVNKEVLSLEEMLAEGAGTTISQKHELANANPNTTPHFSKAQIKALQEAMYHSAENNHLGKIFIRFFFTNKPFNNYYYIFSCVKGFSLRISK